jgi:hypothetical protein
MTSLTPESRRSRRLAPAAAANTAQEVAARLQAEVAGGVLTFTGQDAQSAELDFLLQGTFSLGSLTLVDPQISAKLTTLTVSGSAELMSLSATRIAITIDYGGPQMTMTLNRPCRPTSWPEIQMGLTELVLQFAKGQWSSSGTLDVVLHELRLSFQAQFQKAGKTKRFQFLLAAGKTEPTLSLAPIGSLSFQSMEFLLTRAQEREARWGFRAGGLLAIDFALSFSLKGTASIPPEGASAGIQFDTDPSAASEVTVKFHDFGLPDPPPRVVFDLEQVTLAKTHDGWSLTAEAGTCFAGMPSFLTKPIPGTPGPTGFIPQTPRSWSVSISADGFQLSIDRLWDPGGIEATLPTIQVHGAGDVSLGVLWMDAVNWKVALEKDKDASLGVVLRFLASHELNRIFGVEPGTQTPKYEVFKTYANKAERERKAVELSFGISIENGIAAELLDSPITYIDFTDGYWIFTLGNPAPAPNFGKLKAKSPTFSFNPAKESFGASLQYEIVEPLKIPLAPFKAALAAAGLSAVAEHLPDAEPVAPIAIVTKDAQGKDHLNDQKLLQLLDRIPALSPSIREAIVDVLGVVETFLQRTPGDFNDYLRFGEIPGAFSGSIDVGPAGASIDIQSSTPLQFLLPGVDPVFGPELEGISLRGVTLGAAAGGAVEILKLDATLDRFDLVTFLLCEVAGQTVHGGSVKDVQRRYVFDHLLALIPAAAPVPIPIFFNDLGIAYSGWDGLGFETRWGFPEPDVGFLSLLSGGKALYQFLTDSGWYFDPKQAAPAGLDLPIDLGPNFIQLPPHLGGTLLGTRKRVEYKIWQSLANLMNFLKRGDLEDLLGVFPIQVRVGATTASIGPLSIRGAYALTTPEEFTSPAGKPVLQTLTRALGYVPDGSRLLDILPRTNGKPPEGLVSLVFGQLAVARAFQLTGGFAIVAVGGRTSTWAKTGEPQSAGMATVALFSGGADALVITLQGELGVSAAGHLTFSLQADVLVLNQRPLLRGATSLEVRPDVLTARVTFEVTGSFAITGGFTLSASVVAIDGSISWTYAKGVEPFTADGSASLSAEGFEIGIDSGALYGVQVSGTARLGLDGKTRGSLGIDISKDVTKAFLSRLSALPAEINQQFQEALDAFNQALQAYQDVASLNGLRKALPQVIPRIKTQINSGIDHYVETSKSIPGIAKGAAKTIAKTWARDNVFPDLDQLNRIAAKGDDASLRKALQTALGKVLAINSTTYPITVFGKTFRISLKGTLTAQQVSDLKQAIQDVPKIPAKETSMKLAEQVKTTLRSRLSTFQTIAEQIAQKALEQVPQIRSIAVATDLASVAQSLPVSASVWYGGKTYPIGLDFDLMNPAKAAAEIANGFSEAYPPASLASARRGKNAKRKGTKKTRGATRKK